MFRSSGQRLNITGSTNAYQPKTRVNDFNTVVERHNTGSLKYDSAVHHGYDETVLPLWVADMDFPTAPAILDALERRVDHGIFGYSEPSEGYYQSIVDWWKANHNYSLDKEWILDSPGVVFSIATAIRAFTKPGDSILIQTPVYYPFYDMIKLNNRKLVTCPLVYSDRKYSIDFDAFSQTIEQENVQLFILCNPHNPVGRVWSPYELEKLGLICVRHNIPIISDEIHCDITAPNFKHTVFAGLSPQLEQYTVTLTSPSKTFNLSGLQISHAFIANKDLRKLWEYEKSSTGYNEPGVLGMVACQTAYEQCRDWLTKLRIYINANELFALDYLKQYVPGVYAIERQGTYLLWLDFWGTGMTPETIKYRLVERGKLWLYDGSAFGEEGEGFQRLNLACPRETLTEALTRLAVALSRG
ncbi:MAG: pyridoxal phosphate-dependent aminotransferase [Clostridiales bacterium]|nr:pyridoxal phosphate-dependent aminotransferase [Clostridiales bacterium]